MKAEEFGLSLSAIDEERYGIRTARVGQITRDTLPDVMKFCRDHKVVLLIARCLVSEIRTAQAMEKQGFLLMDTLVHWEWDLNTRAIPEDVNKIPIRPIRKGEVEQVEKLARVSFRGYPGHYRADERLDPDKCDEAYISWAVRSCVSQDVADEVLVASDNNSIIGFITLRLNSPNEGQAILSAVSPNARRKGIFRSLLIHGMLWCLGKGANRVILSTQLSNKASQKAWARLGFVPYRYYYTFHKWFEPS